MAQWGHVDLQQLRRLHRKLEKIQNGNIDQLCRKTAKELAARLLRKVKLRTPVGQYAQEGKTGGALRRGWDIGEVVKEGNFYKIEVINQTEYAAYVEYGHRTANHKGWVPGQFFLTISETELEQDAPKIIEWKVMDYLKRCFEDE